MNEGFYYNANGEEPSGSSKYDEETFKKKMVEHGVPKETMKTMLEAMDKADKPEYSIIFVNTDGDMTVEAIHAPNSALGDKGPLVLFPGANKKTLIAAWSREFIEEQLIEIDKMPEQLRDAAWELFVQWMADKVSSEYAANPPAWREELI